MKLYEIEVTFTRTATVSVVAVNDEQAIKMAKINVSVRDMEDEYESDFSISDYDEIDDIDDIPEDAIMPSCKQCNFNKEGICKCPKHLYEIPIEKFKMICDDFC